MILSEEQKKALSKIERWKFKKNKPYFTLTGIAGSGKTTLIKYIVESLNYKNVKYMAYTGKATQVLLSKKYNDASTIHSTIYNVYVDKKGDYHFDLKSRFDIIDYDLFVVDEASMLNEQIISDLLSFDIPVLFIGDHNQLQPIEGVNTLISKPNIMLLEPHRQAKENSIIEFSQKIIEGDYSIFRGKKYGNNVKILKYYEAKDKIYKEADQIICGYNKTRKTLNEKYRIGETYPINGEKLICKKNNWNEIISWEGGILSLTNGLIGYAKNDVNEESAKLTFKPEFTQNEFDVPFDAYYWNTEIIDHKFKRYNKFLLGYAITCHAAQGSEWENVVLKLEAFGNSEEEKRKWIYTAVTRAKNNITIII